MTTCVRRVHDWTREDDLQEKRWSLSHDERPPPDSIQVPESQPRSEAIHEPALRPRRGARPGTGQIWIRSYWMQTILYPPLHPILPPSTALSSPWPAPFDGGQSRSDAPPHQVHPPLSLPGPFCTPPRSRPPWPLCPASPLEACRPISRWPLAADQSENGDMVHSFMLSRVLC